MKSCHLLKGTLVLVAAFCCTVPPSWAQVDTTPPTLTGFTFSPMAVNTTTSPATVSLTAQVTDDISGVERVVVIFASPTGHSGPGVNLISTLGSDLNGTWAGTATFPAHGEAGTWTVFSVLVTDNVNNNRFYYTSDLQALGFPTQLQVTSNNQDTTPPTLTGFTFSPMAVNTTTSPATVSLTAQVTDDISGVERVVVIFASPTGHSGPGVNLILTLGSDLNGTWAGTATFPAHGEAGTWTVFSVLVTDNVNNNRFYYTSDLQALGFPTQLQVTSNNQDTTPPTLTGFTFSPMAVNTTTSPATVSLTAQVTDDISGVERVVVIFASPTGHSGPGVNLILTLGSDLNGTWAGTATFPAHGEAGTWTVFSVLVTDNVNNNMFYLHQRLAGPWLPHIAHRRRG